MKRYDVIIIGSGAGSALLNGALTRGLRTALIDKGPVGGTCLNLGCIPSKMLITPADRIMQIKEAAKLGIRAEIETIDFQGIMQRMRTSVGTERDAIRSSLRRASGLDFYEAQAEFVDDYVISVAGQRIKGRKIFIASGARPYLPPIEGLQQTGFLTNESLLQLRELPESLIIVGGGYIAAEYAHFFAAMGVRVCLLQRAGRLLTDEEPDISTLLEAQMARRMEVHTNMEVTAASAGASHCTVVARAGKTGESRTFTAEKILVAADRTSNADLLNVSRTGVRTDANGYIRVDDYLQTSQKNIFAFGDAIGKHMFRHAANYQAQLAWQNAMDGDRLAMNERAVPHAVFSYPQIASVGLTEAVARSSYDDVLVGMAAYTEVAKGQAMMADKAFAKTVVRRSTGEILGFHIIGPQAAILIQEVVNAMATAGTVMPIIHAMHIHPALSELIQAAIGNLRDPGEA